MAGKIGEKSYSNQRQHAKAVIWHYFESTRAGTKKVKVEKISKPDASDRHYEWLLGSMGKNYTDHQFAL